MRTIFAISSLFFGGEAFGTGGGRIPMGTPARRSLPADGFELREIPGKGLGVVATKEIPPNTVVGEYTGEVLTERTMKRRYERSVDGKEIHPEDVQWYQSRKERGQTMTGDYLYRIAVPPTQITWKDSDQVVVDDDGGGGRSRPDAIYVDAEDEYESLWTRFLNHSPDPNLNGKSIHESYDGRPRVWFVTNRMVLPNEELCFDYGDDYWLPTDNVVS
jgi:hypothetical protein